VTLYGTDTISSSWPAYCDHFHLYSFAYENVQPASSPDISTDLSVWAWSMIGFPGACTYTDWLAISTPVIEGTIWATTGDQFAWTCGYWVEYEWDGYDDATFEIASMNAVVKAVSALGLAAFTSILF
jgi:hypothetical protein